MATIKLPAHIWAVLGTVGIPVLHMLQLALLTVRHFTQGRALAFMHQGLKLKEDQTA